MNPALVQHILRDDPVRVHLPCDDWQRVYGKLSSQGATLVYENANGPVSAVVASVSADARQVQVRPWSDDPALPALPALLARHADAIPVRYRPGKRCTLRKGELFLKLVADERGCAINRDARLLWAGQQAGMFAFGVARPAGWLPSPRMNLQHRVVGMPIIEQLWSAEGSALSRRLGQANATLAASPLTPPMRFTYAHQIQRTAKYALRLAKYLPHTGALLDQLMVHFKAVIPGPANRPIHGAPHAHQWLDGPDGLKLVDFDRFCLGDPELDVATFVAEADFEDATNATEVGKAYRDGFAGSWRLNPSLTHAYRLHKHVAKALRTATAIRLDAEERTMAILANAARLMEKCP